MGKRKAPEDTAPTAEEQDDDSGTSDDDDTLLDVDFEWFDPQEIDFHGLKTLLRQLFDVDNELFELSALTEMIIAQPQVGSTVKCEGKESDPFAFLTVLNMHEHRDKIVIKELQTYLSAKASSIPSLSPVAELLSAKSDARIGLILTERFINMPTEIAPPLYTMLFEELKDAIEEKQPFQFTHYLLVSRTYTEIVSKLDEDESRPQKKKKSRAATPNTFHFHPEDEVLHDSAIAHGNFDYTKQGDEGAADSKRAFQDSGIRPQGHLILIEAGKLGKVVKALEDFVKPS